MIQNPPPSFSSDIWIKIIRNNFMKNESTLILIREGDRILLGKKKRGFGAGRYNGFGGKLDSGETVLESVKRELKEEADIEVADILKIGEVTFYLNDDKDGEILFVHIYLGKGIIGTPIETEEMIPEWFDINAIPYEMMWPDDIYWYPYALKEIPFEGYCKFAGDNTTITDQNFKERKKFNN